MTVIKKIIFWLIELIRNLFRRKNNDSVEKQKESKKKNKKSKNKADIIIPTNTTLPSYLIISDHDKDQLIYKVTLMKNAFLEESTKIKDNEEKELIKQIQEKYDIRVSEILDRKDLDTIVKNLNNEDKKAVINEYNNINTREKEFKIHLNEVDKVINEIAKNKISIFEEQKIEDAVDNITNDKELSTDIDQKVDSFCANIREVIDDIDDYFINEVKREYNKVNYVTVSTLLIDKNYERYKKLENDFKNHRYNKYYYEREISKIKKELKKIENLKNKKDVSNHINQLKKELYTKSKDKYDLLYNNEVFMNFNKECDMLLEKVNTKVIDIKKDNKPKDEIKDDKEEKKKKYLDNILKRFRDMELARRLISLSQIEDNELINNKEVDFVNMIYDKYNNGVDGEFNFIRNKKKTELVIMFNELNMAISKETKKPFISIDHINFRMNDLEEAVEVKKKELDNTINHEKPLEIDKSKVLVYKKESKKNDSKKKE